MWRRFRHQEAHFAHMLAGEPIVVEAFPSFARSVGISC
jgi:hypothetical protein